MRNKLTVYLCDLTHDYLKMRQFIPLGIGYLASYAQAVHGDTVDIRLFKSVDKLLDAAHDKKPDLLGLSNYTWNLQLSLFGARKVKELYPDLPVVMGGPNIGTDDADIEAFLVEHQIVDTYCMFSAEKSVSKIMGALLQAAPDQRTGGDLRALDLDGCYSLNNGVLKGNNQYDDEKDLDFVPSPYTTHLLDEFLDEGMIPLFETNRGCPYSCSFCAWGISALNKLRRFSLERVTADLDYVAQYGKHYSEFHFVDANFGILMRDVEIAQKLRDLYDETEAFGSVIVYWSKAGQPQMIDIGKILGHLTTTYVAFQSLDEDVLGAMKRRNINTDKLLNLIGSLKGYTHSTHTDILVGSPSETFDSHLASLDGALDYGIYRINGGEIRMLPGTDMETAASRELYGIKTKYRLFEGGSGIYRGELVYELEETIRETNTMTESEMIQLRILRAMFFGSVTLGEHWPLISYLTHNKVRFTQILLKLVERQDSNPKLASALNWLQQKAEEEFFDTPEAIAEFLSQENADDVLFGEKAFLKLNFGFTARLLLNPDEFDAYYQELEIVLLEELASGEADKVVPEILRLCRERSYISKYLNGNPETEISLNLSQKTMDSLSDSGYLEEGSKPEGGDQLRMYMDPVVAQQIQTEMEKCGDKLNLFSLSQIMQMFWGRCHLKPYSYETGKLEVPPVHPSGFVDPADQAQTTASTH